MWGKDYVSSHHLYITRIPHATVEQRNEVITKMAEAGVACNVHYKPLPMMTAYKQLGFDIKDYPNAYDRYHNEVTLPLHTLLSDEDVDYVIDTYRNVLKEMKLI
jgi:dTDP-4-amino-4,6-dideoxygalactose transaminase